jgi:hypothetical protein
MTLDPADTPHVVGNIGTVPYYSHRETDGTWSPPIELSMPTYATAIAAADAEHAFIASYFDLAHTGIWYTRPGGDPGQLMNVSGFSTSQAIAASAVALDSLGRPHVLFNVPNFDIPEFGMWYAVGPEPANW